MSLDVLPVKGPQGPALRVTEPSLKVPGVLVLPHFILFSGFKKIFSFFNVKIFFHAQTPETLQHRQSESWTIHPEQLVLATPTISEWTVDFENEISPAAHNLMEILFSFFHRWCSQHQSGPDPEQHIQRAELRFVLAGSLSHHHTSAWSYWASVRLMLMYNQSQCLSWTSIQFNVRLCVCYPRCHLQILISPNPSLANKAALLPWSGQIYVQCDGQQKVCGHTGHTATSWANATCCLWVS